jgi:hypothetical protein
LDVQNFWQSISDKNQIKTTPLNIENSLLLQLAKDALIDANITEHSYTNGHLSLIVNDYRIDQPDENVSQLANSLGLNHGNQNVHHFTKSLGQGLNIVIEHLQSRKVDSAVLIIIDSQSAAALVFKRWEEVIEKKERVYAVPLLLHEESLNTDENSYQTLNDIYNQTEFQSNSVELLAITAPHSSNLQSHISSLSQCFRHSTKAWCSLRTSIVQTINLNLQMW